MSQTRSLNMYFVLPCEDRNAECCKEMNEAFGVVKEYKGNPQWVLPSFCLTHTPQPKDVFVFETFHGEAFEKLKSNSAKIIGAKCMLACVTAGDSIPPGKAPIYSEAMRGMLVCCAGVNESRALIKEKIEYMSGNYAADLRAATTHLVVGNIVAFQSNKMLMAYKNGIQIVKESWVDAVWQSSCQDISVKATDPEFDVHKAPLFYNMRMTTSSIPRREKEKLQQLVSYHGGLLIGSLEEKGSNLLIINHPVGEKFNAARKWRIPCVKSDWIYQCIESRKVLSTKNYILGPEISTKVSTPEKAAVNLSCNFSCVSAITADDKYVTHLDETEPTRTDITISQQPKTAVNDIINNLMANLKEAGQFLDGCNIFLAGFSQDHLEKLKKILNYGGATRLDELAKSVTHIVAFGSPQKEHKNLGAHIVNVEWLAESITLKRPAPVDHCVVVDNKKTPASPLSKQGALLLNSRTEPVNDVVEPVHFQVEDDLLDRYQLSQPGEPLPSRHGVRNTPTKTIPRPPTSSSMKSESTCSASVFNDCKIYVSRGIGEQESQEIENEIRNCGGVIVSSKFSGVADYAVVPIAETTLTQIAAREVVNVFFIKDCILDKTIVPLQYYHSPVTWVVDSQPLEDCVVSVSQYHSSEREFVENLIDILGGTVQAILARKSKPGLFKTTHLICSEPTGNKYNGALRWQLPVVHHKWLLICAEKGIRVSEEPYLIGDCKLTAQKNSSSSYSCVAESARKVSRNPVSENSVPVPKSPEKYGCVEETPMRCSSQSFPSKPTLVAGKKLVMSDNSVSTPVAKSPEKESGGATSQAKTNLSQPQPGSSTPIARKMPLQLTQVRTPETNLPPAVLTERETASPFNRNLERVRQLATPTNLDNSGCSTGTATPTSPYGAFYGNDNPSPGTRKRLYRWMNQGADFPLDPEPSKPTNTHRDSPPITEYLSKHLKSMMAHRDEASPAKRRNISSQESTTKNDLMNGLQKMREIEQSYSRTNQKVTVSPIKSSAEAKMVIVAESQPHTEIGWEDPTDKENALANLEKAVERPPKVFMFSGLAETTELAKKIVQKSGGQVSTLTVFDKNATHMIAANTTSRAEKLMGSIAGGLWILHPSYLKQLQVTKDVYAVEEKDYEWGNPDIELPDEPISNTVKECMESAYKWRLDRKAGKPGPFHGLKFILGIGESKRESFRRLIEVGGGQVISADAARGNQVFCLCDATFNSADYAVYLRRNITCVTMLFVSDVILRKPNAATENLAPLYAQLKNQS